MNMSDLDEALARVTAEWVLTNDEWKELEPIVAAALNWQALTTKGREVEPDTCEHGHISCTTLTLYDLIPGRYLLVPIEAVRVTGENLDALAVSPKEEE